jgi:hypothetical protein
VKELTPEFFYQPEIFYNGQGFDFGCKQNDEGKKKSGDKCKNLFFSKKKRICLP